ncbi:geranylgeranyl reductase family protein [Actinospica durhamensis]|uniref:Geranylgeranyl reductase family protein n=1 Tax=Actinospica durhamensis TaxID=1508375 RepID=A0A941IRP3_9ACTN|nr:geranylgeranyl reductase family protein [Actinospica durhamensis]MBR7834133.1 geranylgeranyl reductase family protein [Actinospica durhamensis]
MIEAPKDLSSSADRDLWDVVVVGAGPAGSNAARAAAQAGAERVLLLEKSELPRYKTCGGGLIGYSRRALPEGFDVPVRQRIDAITFTHDGTKERTRRDKAGDLLVLVNRAEFDLALAKAAVEAGAVLRTGATVSSVDQPGPAAPVTLNLADGSSVRARAVVGADGSASRIGRYVGVRCEQVDLGLEAEIQVPQAVAAHWANRVLVDWGPLPGSYGWVFPKGDVLTVGVISARGDGEATRTYYRDFIRRLGLEGFPTVSDSGHLTRCREEGSPLSRGRVLVAGDAAGLLEPWTREGISFALRSGALAGTSAAELARRGRTEQEGGASDAGYAAAVEHMLGVEMQAGRSMLALFERHPAFFHRVVTLIPVAFRLFADFCRGRTSPAKLIRNPVAQNLLRTLPKPKPQDAMEAGR